MVTLIVCSAFSVGHAATKDDDFYKGNAIRLIVAFSVGGG